MKADIMHLALLLKQKSVAESLHAYINRARECVRKV